MVYAIRKEEGVFAKIDAINAKLAKKDRDAHAHAGKGDKKGSGGFLGSLAALGASVGGGVFRPSAVNLDELHAQWRDQLSEAFSWVTRGMPLPLPSVLSPPDKVRPLFAPLP